MKYNQSQKEKAKKGISMHKISVFKQIKLDICFPIKVEIKDGFYIIESKLNRQGVSL